MNDELKEKVRAIMLELNTITILNNAGFKYVIGACLSLLGTVLHTIDKKEADDLRKFIFQQLSEDELNDKLRGAVVQEDKLVH